MIRSRSRSFETSRQAFWDSLDLTANRRLKTPKKVLCKKRLASCIVTIPLDEVLRSDDPARSQRVSQFVPWPVGRGPQSNQSLTPPRLNPPGSVLDGPPTVPPASNACHCDATPHADHDRSPEGSYRPIVLRSHRYPELPSKGKNRAARSFPSSIIHRGHQATRRILWTKPWMRRTVPKYHRPFLSLPLPPLVVPWSLFFCASALDPPLGATFEPSPGSNRSPPAQTTPRLNGYH